MTFRDIIEKLRMPLRGDERRLRQQLKDIIGFYPHNIEHYRAALTHSSSGKRNDKGRPLNNERLEFLGDAILDAVVGHIVYERFPSKREGFLTNTRSKLVSRESLGKLAVEMGLTELIQSRGQQRAHNNYMAGNAFEALVGAIYLDQGYDAAVRFMEKRILSKMVNIDKVAYKEVNFKSKLLEWTQKNRVRLEFCTLEQKSDSKGSPVFGIQVVIEGVKGPQAQGYSKKEAHQKAAKEALEKLRREPQFIDAIFAAKSDRTKMEEMPTTAAPDLEAEKTNFINKTHTDNGEKSQKPANAEAVNDGKRKGRNARGNSSEEPQMQKAKDKADNQADEFDLSDITHNPAEQSREDIIAAAEAAAFEDSKSSK